MKSERDEQTSHDTDCAHTHTHTHTHLDYHQSLTPSYALTLGSFPWHTAAIPQIKSNHRLHIIKREKQHFFQI